MKTKTIFLVAALALIVGNTQLVAQNTTEATCKNKANVAEMLDKRCNRLVVALSLDETTAAKFTPLYREYVLALKNTHPTQCKRNTKEQCTDAERIAKIEKRFEVRQEMLNVQKKYFNEFKKILNARQLETLFSAKGKNYGGKHCGNAHGTRHQSHCNKQHHNNNHCRR